MLQMYLHPLDDTSHEAQCSGATQIRPTPDQAGLVTHRDLLARPGPGGMQALRCSGPARPFQPHPPSPYPSHDLLPHSSTISFPWQSTPRLLSQWPFLHGHHFSCLLRLNIPAQILHYQHPLHPILGLFPIFFNLPSSFLAGYLDTPHHLFA